MVFRALIIVWSETQRKRKDRCDLSLKISILRWGATPATARWTKRCSRPYFGLKAHIGVDAESGLVHTLTTTPANTADITETSKLLHGQEQSVFADAAYIGAEKREELAKCEVTWYIAAKRSQVDAIEEEELKSLVKHVERLKASVRARVEHPFHIVKNLFGYR
jgi:transposase, IS5 family